MRRCYRGQVQSIRPAPLRHHQFELFTQRHERGATIVARNLPIDVWAGVFGSERLTGALVDRFTHRVHILDIKGDSYRLEQSTKRR